MSQLAANFWYCDRDNPIMKYLNSLEAILYAPKLFEGDGLEIAGNIHHCDIYIEAHKAAHTYWLDPRPLGPFDPDKEEQQTRDYEKKWEILFGPYELTERSLKFNQSRQELWDEKVEILKINLDTEVNDRSRLIARGEE